ncbi:histidine kinase [Stenotrophomonas sp. SAU14A_NAIMI4_5]|uniref:DUF1801 domain-containing protein n=1 Tax=Stenotrophomonas sp. SAU14A_NAIMI4_5 TaxID=2072413 RepID=UPI000D5411A9|nr:DUF1801 domain-containing protein [Stenotrophomonas sp. SAU14A_NAIMI4_5]AWH48864.1 histidine kinase [Stenotrophomonas sp. SAU14A_NAIMI4_5]
MPAKPSTTAAPKLLSGGNPQIAKGDGDGPVQAYIAAMPGWKRAFGEQLDALITEAVPGVHKAVRWNSPMYGVGEGKGWFLSFHCCTRYIKVALFHGTLLKPEPPEPSRQATTRYLHLYEDSVLDRAQLVDWLQQARALPGVRL